MVDLGSAISKPLLTCFIFHSDMTLNVIWWIIPLHICLRLNLTFSGKMLVHKHTLFLFVLIRFWCWTRLNQFFHNFRQIFRTKRMETWNTAHSRFYLNCYTKLLLSTKLKIYFWCTIKPILEITANTAFCKKHDASNGIGNWTFEN